MSSTIIQFDQIPDATPDDNGFIELPVVVLSSQVVFPNTLIPLTPQGERGQAAIQYSLDNNTTLISVLARRHDSDADLIHQFHDIGTEIAVQPMPLRQLRALIPNTLAQGRQRVRILEMVQTEPYLVARAQIVADACTVDEEELSNIVDTALEMFDQLASLNMFISDEVGDLIEQIDDPSELCDLVGSTLDITVDERQELLELDNLAARYERLIQLLANQISVQEVREEVNSAVHGEMARIQREAYLREQMRVIQSELGDEEYAQADIEQLHHSVLAANMPQEVQDKALTELKRLATMPSIAPEASVIRSYVEWLADLPWQSNTRDNLNLNHAEKVLEEAHFGLDKVKDRIVEHIAVRKMAKENEHAHFVLCWAARCWQDIAGAQHCQSAWP